MVQVKIFGAIAERLGDARDSVEEQANEWLRDKVRATATVQSAPALLHANGKYHLIVTLTVTTAE